MTTVAPDADPAWELRPATRGDLEAVYRIERASFSQPWPPGSFEPYLFEGGFVVAEGPDGEVRGYVVADAIPTRDRPIGHVKDLAVAPAHRDRGLGSALLRRGLAYLASAGAGTAKLEVRESNAGAIRLYRRFGFERERTIRGYYGDDEDALVMGRDLEDWPVGDA